MPGVHIANLRMPSDARGVRAPIVVNLHGGFWKSDWGLHNLVTAELLRAFGSRDIASWDVEYARVDQGDPSSSTADGGWPHTCLDVLAALNSLTQLPPSILAQLDLDRIYLCGHSAGAHLALWLASVSRQSPAERSRLAGLVHELAGPEAAEAMAQGVSSALVVVGVAALAPVTSLMACATAGLSDFHDAAANFLWRVVPSSSAVLASGQLGAADPMALLLHHLSQLEDHPAPAPAPAAAAAEAATAAPLLLPPLRILLAHGLADVDVPSSLSLALAAVVWSHPSPPPLWLQLLAECDHYEVAGLCPPLGAGDKEAAAESARQASAGQPAAATAAAIRPWGRVAAALRAFVTHDDATLAALSCPSLKHAEALSAEAEPPVCARQTLSSIATGNESFAHWAASQPASAARMARGLRRWFAQSGEAPA